MATVNTKITNAQRKTLATIIANGGEMNGWAGQKGFYCNSVPVLTRQHLIEPVNCPCGTECTATEGFTCPTDGQDYYHRVRITDAGRAALDVEA